MRLWHTKGSTCSPTGVTEIHLRNVVAPQDCCLALSYRPAVMLLLS